MPRTAATLDATPLAIDDPALETVTGAGMWNAVDKTIGKVDPGWSAKSCASRGGWVGWGVGSLLGGAQWAAYPWTGPVGMAVTGPIAGLIGTASVSSYIDNCDHQKPHG